MPEERNALWHIGPLNATRNLFARIIFHNLELHNEPSSNLSAPISASLPSLDENVGYASCRLVFLAF